jgi:hypothetical protein
VVVLRYFTSTRQPVLVPFGYPVVSDNAVQGLIPYLVGLPGTVNGNLRALIGLVTGFPSVNFTLPYQLTSLSGVHTLNSLSTGILAFVKGVDFLPNYLEETLFDL